jgi:hypothetical protein
MNERLAFATAKWRTAQAEVECLRAELASLKRRIEGDDDPQLAAGDHLMPSFTVANVVRHPARIRTRWIEFPPRRLGFWRR